MSDDNDDSRDAALHHTARAACEYDNGEEFDVREWARGAEEAKEPYPDGIDETTCGWPRVTWKSSMTRETQRNTRNRFRRTQTMSEWEGTNLWEGIRDAANDRFARPDQEFEF